MASAAQPAPALRQVVVQVGEVQSEQQVEHYFQQVNGEDESIGKVTYAGAPIGAGAGARRDQSKGNGPYAEKGRPQSVASKPRSLDMLTRPIPHPLPPIGTDGPIIPQAEASGVASRRAATPSFMLSECLPRIPDREIR